MAKRYDQEKKDAVVAFIQEYNEKNGRGGQSSAGKKYSINPITIKTWMEKAGIASPGKTGKKLKSMKAAPRASKMTSVGNSNPKLAVLEKMTSIQKAISELQSEFGKLKTAL